MKVIFKDAVLSPLESVLGDYMVEEIQKMHCIWSSVHFFLKQFFDRILLHSAQCSVFPRHCPELMQLWLAYFILHSAPVLPLSYGAGEQRSKLKVNGVGHINALQTIKQHTV